MGFWWFGGLQRSRGINKGEDKDRRKEEEEEVVEDQVEEEEEGEEEEKASLYWGGGQKWRGGGASLSLAGMGRKTVVKQHSQACISEQRSAVITLVTE